MKKILILCLTMALLCVGCSEDSRSKKKGSGIKTSAATDKSDGEQDSNSETEAAVTTNNTIITTETSGEEKEFIVTEQNEENITTAVSSVSTAKTPEKTHINTTAKSVEKPTEATTTETKSEVIELPFVPIG